MSTNKVPQQIAREYWNKQCAIEQADYFALQQTTSPYSPKEQNVEICSIELTNLEQIKDKYAKSSIALFTFNLALIKTLLFRYINHENPALCTTSLKLKPEDIEGEIHFISSQIHSSDSFKTVLKDTKNRLLEGYQHQGPECLKACELQNVSTPIIGAYFEGIQLESEHLKDCNLLFCFDKEGNLKIKFNPANYSNEFIKQLGTHLNEMMNSAAEDIDIPIMQFPLNSASDIPTIKPSYPVSETIISIFEKQATLFPNNIALEYESNEITYNTLNERANQVAWKLRELGVQPDDLVSILLERSMEMVIAILGVLKSGAAYVPIDPDYPQERIDYTLEDSKTAITISQTEHKAKLDGHSNITTILLSDLNSNPDNTKNLPIVNTPADLAYIIYTSGSTGKPKGVMVEHRNVVRLFFTDQPLFEFGPDDVWTLFHSYCFDFSVWEMYGALLFGGKIAIVPKLIAQNPVAFRQLLIEQKVTILNQTPGAFYNLIQTEETRDFKNTELNALRYVIFGGEALAPDRLKTWHDHYADTKLINMYGITETTVHVTYKEISSIDINNGSSNIGKPIPTLSIYILDPHGNQQPTGVPGEMFVSGEGVARGYLNRPELTAERFINDSTFSSERLYKTGDVAKKLFSGDLEYLGRNDNQVKIRGYRIELGEIESALRQHPEVKDVIVSDEFINETDSYKTLVAYIVETTSVNASDLRTHLLASLPNHMIPSYYVSIHQIPLTSNGKINKKALPSVQESIMELGTEYVAPKTEKEKGLSEIWAEVLQKEQVGVLDNFFLLGGDSLKVIRIVSLAEKRLGIPFSIKHVFQYPTIRELLEIEISADSELSISEQLEIGRKEIAKFKTKIESEPDNLEKLPASYEDLYPLSSIEAGMIYSSILRPEEPVYYDQFAYLLNIENVDIFLDAFHLMVEKHSILRARFYMNQFREPLKAIVQLSKQALPIRIENISEQSGKDQQKTINAYLAKDYSGRYEFNGDLIWHMKAFHLGDNTYRIVWTVHHAILDGWSINAFNTELMNLSSDPDFPNKSQLEPLKHNYKDYCAISLARKISENHKTFWNDKLEGNTRNKLPFNLSGKRKNDIAGMKGISIYPEGDWGEKIDRLAKQQNVTAKAICLAAHVYLMHVISSETDVLTGVVSHHRPAIEDGDKILGCFLNTLPIRVNFSNTDNYKTLLHEVNDYLIEVKGYEIDLVDIANLLGEKTTIENPLFDCIFNFTDFHVLEDAVGSDQISVSSKPITNETKISEVNQMTNTLFDLEVDKTFGNLRVKIKYTPAFFDGEDIRYALNLYVRILDQLIVATESKLNIASILSEEEKQKILYDFNDTIVDYPKDTAMHQLFEEQVIQSPNVPALIQEGQSLTYQKLNERSNQVAHYLVAQGIQQTENVGLITGRSFDMIIAMYGILKAGGAYVPIDPTYPLDRQKYIVSNSNVSLILVDFPYPIENDLSNEKQFIDLNDKEISTFPKVNPNIASNPNDLAYTIYTSGSTGRPKGVMIEHHSATNLITWVNKTYDIGVKDRLLFITSMCFDLSVYDIFGTLACGAAVVIARKEQVEDPELLKQLMIDEKITFWDSVPTTMNYLVNMIETSDESFVQNDLRVVFMSGDWIPVNLRDRILNYFPKTKVIGLGGATEGTVWSNFYPIESVEKNQISIPYGVPIDNNFFYVLDDAQNPVPRGVAGELHIGGIGVARGYANDAEKTAAQFVKDPFSILPNAMMYKTGDLGRLQMDGNMEFLGRKDFQVKIRGFRVELGEIENQLLTHVDVKEAVVLAKTDGNNQKFLCAYVVKKNSVESSLLKAHLLQELPDYMIPAYFIEIKALPLTSNGKIDRKALPDPKTIIDETTEFEAPKSEMEIQLAQLWQDLLEIERIGINENIFDLGAHSLHAGAFVSRVHKVLEVELTLRELFSNPTISGLAQLIAGKESTRYLEIIPIQAQDHYPLSHAQHQLWLAHQMNPENPQYNLSGRKLLNGSVNAEAFQQTFEQIIERHEALRTSFHEIEGTVRQIIHDDIPFKVELVDLRQEDDEQTRLNEQLHRNAYSPFDLTKAPLVRIAILQLSGNKFALLYSMHHIISDGWSMGLMIQETIQVYNQLSNNQVPDLEPLSLHFKDYVAWENQILSGERLTKLETFWSEHMQGSIQSVHLPVDKLRIDSSNKSKGKNIGFSIEPELSEKIYDQIKAKGVTLNVYLIAVYNLFLAKISNSEEITIRSIASGRNQSELEQLVGYFVRVFGFKNNVTKGTSFDQFLRTVQERYIQVLDHSMYPFEKVLNEHKPIHANQENLINVSFALQNLNTIAALQSQENLSSMEVEQLNFEGSIARNDLLLTVNESNQQLYVSFNFRTELFHESKIKLFASWFESLLKQVVTAPDQKIEQYSLINGTETALFQHLNVKQETYSHIAPLTTIQRDLYLDSIFNPDEATHSLAFFIELKEDLDVQLWKKAVQLLVDKSPALRLELIIRDNEVYQGVRSNFELAQIQKDLRDKQLTDDQINQFIEEEAKVPYNFKKDDLLRHVLIQRENNHFYSLLCAHHVLFDGWSFKLFFEKVSDIYTQLKASQIPSKEEDTVFLEYVNEHLQKFDTASVKSYWEDKLANVEPLHIHHHANANDAGKLISKTFEIVPAQLKAIEAYCTANKISQSLYFKSLFGLLIQLYGRAESDFTIRELLGGRDAKHLDGTGCFYHSIPVCFTPTAFDSQQAITDLFGYVRQQKKELGSHQNISFLLQNELLGKEEITFYYNYQTYFNLALFGKDVPLQSINTYSENQIQLLVRETLEGTSLILDYDDRFFNDYDFLHRLMSISDQIIAGISTIGGLNLITETEQVSSSKENWSERTFPNQSISEIFSETAKSHPARIAVEYNQTTLSYKELEQRSNQLANHLLQAHSIQKDDLIGLMVTRSEQMIVGILGILKTGAAYVPIDPDYPTDRIHHMVSDSQIQIILEDNTSVAIELPDFEGRRYNLTEITLSEDTGSCAAPSVTIDPKSLAYIIYTSGSTGKPKGSMIEHRNVVSLMKNDGYNSNGFEFNFTEQDVWTLFHSFCFDFSVWEIFGAILNGGKVVVVPKETAQNPAEFLSLLKEKQVSVLNQIPSLFAHVANQEIRLEGNELNLRYVIFGGEALRPATLNKWHQKYPETKLVNMYGITETTVHVTYKEVTSKEIQNGTSNIGMAIPTLQCYILNQNLHQLPVGIPGEICITGHGVSRGYLHQPELTKQRFVTEHAISQNPIYRSGDLGRLLPNGEIEYLGRIDHQVKVRGFRIELGEIENQLLKHPSIQDVLVVAKPTSNESNENEIIAYILSNEDFNASDVRSFAGNGLPDYMIPGYFIKLEQFPVTPSGKINQKALPNPSNLENSLGREYVAPESELELKLQTIWQDVLSNPRVGMEDNFFEIGGHSLKATRLITNIHKYLDVELPIRQIFVSPTIRAIAKHIELAEHQTFRNIEPIATQDSYPLSAAQKRMYILNQLQPEDTIYNMPIIMHVRGKLNRTQFENTFQQLIERHESLRTSFQMHDGKPVQVISHDIKWNVEQLFSTEEGVPKYVKEFVRPFDLEQESLLRVALIEIHEEHHILMADMPHIISDGVSMRILVDEFIQIYQNEELPDLKLQYKDFAHWQNELFQTDEIKKQEAFWMDQFKGDIPILNLQTDYARPAVQQFDGADFHVSFSKKQTGDLNNILQTSGTTMYMLLLTAYNILLAKHTSQEDIVVGSPIAGRSHADLDQIIGMFVNTLAMRNYPTSNKTFRSFLNEVKENALAIFQNQDYQFETLVDKLDVKRDLSRNPLFDTMFIFQNLGENERKIKDLSFTPFGNKTKTSKFDLTFQAWEHKGQLQLNVSYCTKLFNQSTIERLTKDYETILRSISTNLDISLSQIQLVNEEDRHKLDSYNSTKLTYPEEGNILQLFHTQVQKSPDSVALAFQKEELTYSELDQKSNLIAAELQSKGLKSGELVAIMMERSPSMLISMIGILKAGATYVPIDPSYPEQRVLYMLKDSGSKLIVSQKEIIEKLELLSDVLSVFPAQILSDSTTTDFSLVTIEASQLAYVIYTSGSTGKPKGVSISHQNVHAFIQWCLVEFKNTSATTVFANTSISFDLSIFELFYSLCSGKKIRLINDALEINNYLTSESNILLNTVPSVILELIKGKADFSNVIGINMAGEPIPLQIKENLDLTALEVRNLYGPSEDTTYSTCYRITKSEAQQFIGKPIGNTQAFVLDKNNKIQSPGIPGELCLAGDGVTKGYLGQPDLSAEKYVLLPQISQHTLYRTGDLVRWNDSGNLEYLGRIDQQVKLRGFRIEPEEIERHLEEFNGIKQAVVLVKEVHNSDHLCGYFTIENPKLELNISELQAFLQTRLPDYMNPSFLTKLDEIPLLPNGKTDRNSLLSIEQESNQNYTAPESEIEFILTEIWEEVLGIEQVGIEDNFYELGGHSLMAMQVILRIANRMQVEVKLTDLFNAPTIKQLSSIIDNREKNVSVELVNASNQEYYDLSHAQKRLWFLAQFSDAQNRAYNMPGAYILTGNIDYTAFQKAFTALIDRHESLRTSFITVNDLPKQKIHSKIECKIEHVNLEGDPQKDDVAKEMVLEEAQKMFDLEKGPLLRFKLLKLEQNKHLFLFTLHHIISDGWSMSILVKDVMMLYQAFLKNEPNPLAPLEIQYKDFSEWQNTQIDQHSNQHKSYWMQQMKAVPGLLKLPYDKPQTRETGMQGATMSISINKTEADALKQLASQANSTIYSTLLSSIYLLLFKMTKEQDLIIGSPVAGRMDKKLEDQIGYYLNTLALRAKVDSTQPFNLFLKEVISMVLEANDHQIYPYDQLVSELKSKLPTSQQGLFNVGFTWNVDSVNSFEVEEELIPDVRIASYQMVSKVAKTDLWFYGNSNEETINLTVLYNAELFETQKIKLHLDNYQKLITNLVQNPDQSIGSILGLDQSPSKTRKKRGRAGFAFEA